MAAKRAKKSKKKAKGKRAVVKVRRSTKAAKRSKTRKPVKAKSTKRAKAKKRTKAKAPAKTAKKVSRKTARKEVFGEGNYTASREFREEQTDFVKKNRARIPALAKEAEKELEGPQGDELRRAEDEARSHAHTEEAAE
jgi:hypothetical protein